MKRVVSGLIIVTLMSFFMTVFASAAQKQVLITEVQTGSANSASEEYIEIYNTTSQDIDISGWCVYYKSATGTSWGKKATVASDVKIQTDDFWVFAANLAGDTSLTSGLSQSGGNIQIRDAQNNVVDQFGWGSGDAAIGASASESQPGQSMYRLFEFTFGLMTNTDNNFNDFDITNTPTPGTFPAQEVIEEDQPVQSYPSLQLSELFPDPASPQSDSADEFIELYNPNTFAVDLSGWKLRDEAGAEFIIKAKSIESNSRLAIFITESKITLNNSGDSVQLVDPNGKITSESANYGTAEEGLSWSYVAGTWQWAVAPTPDTPNASIFIDTSAAGSVESVKKATTKKKAATKAATKPKTSKAKTSTVNASSSQPNLEATEAESQPAQWWSWLLVAIGAVTIGYGIYEYRTEIHIFFRKLGAKLGIRPKVS